MKLIMMVVVGAMLVAIPALADDLCKFKDIPFGTNRYEVYKKLEIGESDYQQDPSTHTFLEYPLGDRVVRLDLKFDDNDKFYGFGFDFNRYAANRIDDSVYDDLAYITATFINKYGKKPKVKKATKSDIIFNEKTHFIYEWNNKKCIAYTGIGHYESEFYAMAFISDTKLLMSQSKKNNMKNIDAVNKAKKDF